MNYFIEVNIGIVFVLIVYTLFLQHETDFRMLRLWLLMGIVCSLVFPLIEIQLPDADTIVLPAITLPEEVIVGASGTSTNFLLMAYVAMAFIIAIPVMLNAFKLYSISRAGNGRYHGSWYVIESNKPLPSWSFFNLIFIGRAAELSDEDKQLVLKHEMLHGRLLHSIDMILITVLCIVFWFNPILWSYRRTMAKIHEFEVDSIIARQDGTIAYSELLAKTALSGTGFLLTHHFNQSFILKRINMINVIKSKISNWKLAVLAAVVLSYFVVIACTEPVADNSLTEKAPSGAPGNTNEVFSIVETTAMPPQGMTKFYEELANELVYPAQARELGIEGKVFVEFIVNKDGSLSDFKVLKGIGAGCDAAALEAVSKMRNWTPGKQKGQVVRQRMVLPITFRLN